MAQYNFRYRSQLGSEEPMLDDLTHLLQTHNIDDQVSRRFLLAVSEAFTNALLHGNKSDPAKQIVIAIRVNDSELHADIIDQGQGGAERIRQRVSPGLLAEGGRGIDLIQTVSDAVQFVETDTGLIVSITVKRDKGCNSIA